MSFMGIKYITVSVLCPTVHGLTILRVLCTRLAHSTFSVGDNHKGLSLILGKQGTIQCWPLHNMTGCCVGNGYTELRLCLRASLADTSIHHTLRWDSTQVLHQCPTGGALGHCSSGQTWQGRSDSYYRNTISFIFMFHSLLIQGIFRLFLKRWVVMGSLTRIQHFVAPFVR